MSNDLARQSGISISDAQRVMEELGFSTLSGGTFSPELLVLA